jgi:uncharacterized protein YegJ (DUF2314 family)
VYFKAFYIIEGVANKWEYHDEKKIIYLIPVCLVTISCSLSSLGNNDPVINVAKDDADMNAAIAKAQETLPLFMEAFQSPAPTQTDFSLKVRFPYGSSGGAEYIWIDDLIYYNDQFKGTVGNDPVYVKDLKYGDHVTINTSDISDWMIIDGGKMLGGYTLHVLRKNMSESERKEMEGQVNFSIPAEPALP